MALKQSLPYHQYVPRHQQRRVIFFLEARPPGCETKLFKRFVSAGQTMRVPYTLISKRWVPRGKRRWRARTPRRFAHTGSLRKAARPWSARAPAPLSPARPAFGSEWIYDSHGLPCGDKPPEELCLTPANVLRAKMLLQSLPGMLHFISRLVL